MKFYYNGQLIRTSKNHHYTHAVVKVTEKGVICYGCSSTEKGAEKLRDGLVQVHNYKVWVSVKNGTYRPKDRWSSTMQRMQEKAVETYGSVDEAVNHWKEIITGIEVVEIEEA